MDLCKKIKRYFYPILPIEEISDDIFNVIYKFLHWSDILKMKKVSRYFNFTLKNISDLALELQCRKIINCLPKLRVKDGQLYAFIPDLFEIQAFVGDRKSVV